MSTQETILVRLSGLTNSRDLVRTKTWGLNIGRTAQTLCAGSKTVKALWEASICRLWINRWLVDLERVSWRLFSLEGKLASQQCWLVLRLVHCGKVRMWRLPLVSFRR